MEASLLTAVFANWSCRTYEKAGLESIWTIRSDANEMFAQAISIVSDHSKATSSTPINEQNPCRILAPGWWIAKPLQYLTVWSKNIRVEELPSHGDEFRRGEDQKARDLDDPRYAKVFASLERGDYVVGPTGKKDSWGGMVELVANTRFSPEDVETWKIKKCAYRWRVGDISRQARSEASSRTSLWRSGADGSPLTQASQPTDHEKASSQFTNARNGMLL